MSHPPAAIKHLMEARSTFTFAEVGRRGYQVTMTIFGAFLERVCNLNYWKSSGQNNWKVGPKQISSI